VLFSLPAGGYGSEPLGPCFSVVQTPTLAYTFVQIDGQERAIEGDCGRTLGPVGGSHFMPLAEDKRFNSWKEIATFLDRDIRTVWRWEKERGLPVHRVPGDGRRAVFAYQSEIRNWLESAEHLSDNDKSTNESRRNGLKIGRFNAALVWGGCFIFVVGIAGVSLLLPVGVLRRAFGHHRTLVERVSPIYAMKTQGIIIDGEGFGPPPKTILLTPEGGVDTYAESYSTSMRIDNLGEGPHHWIAGRGGPLNYCDISVKLASWTDSRIVLTGFDGPLGTSCTDQYRIAPGDKLQIVIWGPQNRCGPGGPPQCPEEMKAGRIATFDTIVLPSKDAPVPLCR